MIPPDAEPAIPARSSSNPGIQQPNDENLNLCAISLEHAITCQIPRCRIMVCFKMKQVIKHYMECEDSLECLGCERFRMVSNAHAKKCDKDECPVPQCHIFREKLAIERQRNQEVADRGRTGNEDDPESSSDEEGQPGTSK